MTTVHGSAPPTRPASPRAEERVRLEQERQSGEGVVAGEIREEEIEVEGDVGRR